MKETAGKSNSRSYNYRRCFLLVFLLTLTLLLLYSTQSTLVLQTLSTKRGSALNKPLIRAKYFGTPMVTSNLTNQPSSLTKLFQTASANETNPEIIQIPLARAKAEETHATVIINASKSNLPEPVLTTSCQPHKKIVFVKTHKTGSSTVATIFERFGDKNSLAFALPYGGHVFSQTYLFKKAMLVRSAPNFKGKRDSYDLLVNHARLDYSPMSSVVPGAKFITIIRHPVKQLESSFGYYEEYKSMGIPVDKGNNAFEVFMQAPASYVKPLTGWHAQIRNGQIYDLGLQTNYFDNQPMIEKKIQELDREFDLVMINEYFDHSLILLKKALCWRMEDILYFSKGVRSSSHRFDRNKDSLKDKILEWNYADFCLYQHFNETLWRKIEEYGHEEFDRELALFQQKRKESEQTCLDPNVFNRKDRREVKPTLKKGAPAWCSDMLREDTSYVQVLRNKQNYKAGVRSNYKKTWVRPNYKKTGVPQKFGIKRNYPRAKNTRILPRKVQRTRRQSPRQ